MKVKVLYFASLKERLLKGEDTVEVPEDVKTVEDLINYLSENCLLYTSDAADE